MYRLEVQLWNIPGTWHLEGGYGEGLRTNQKVTEWWQPFTPTEGLESLSFRACRVLPNSIPPIGGSLDKPSVQFYASQVKRIRTCPLDALLYQYAREIRATVHAGDGTDSTWQGLLASFLRTAEKIREDYE